MVGSRTDMESTSDFSNDTVIDFVVVTPEVLADKFIVPV